MSALWLTASGILLASFGLAGVRCITGSHEMRVVGLQLAATIAVWLILALARLSSQSSFSIVALGVALTSFAGGLAFVRYLGGRM